MKLPMYNSTVQWMMLAISACFGVASGLMFFVDTESGQMLGMVAFIAFLVSFFA